MNLPFVSIIIPVYNDAQKLEQCLALLEAQTYPQNCYEVIVVDNNSTENLKSIIAKFIQAKYVFEPTPGSYCARNTGIAFAQGDIVGFTDSDCSPNLDWIEKGVAQILKHPKCGFVAGRVNFSFQDCDNPTPAELYDSLHFLQQERYVKNFHFGVTANLFTTLAVFKSVGLFNASLKSGGDREWGQRIYAAGYEQIYAEDVVIYHPARSDLQELSQKLYRVYEGEFRIKNQAKMSLMQLIKEVLLDLKPPVSHLTHILKNKEIKNLYKRVSVVAIYMRFRLAKIFIKLRLYYRTSDSF